MIGIDIVEVERIAKALKNGAFLERVFCDSECKYIKEKGMNAQTASAMFAVKEAVSKALGTGISNGVNWRDIEVLHLPTGKPYVELRGAARDLLNNRQLDISISHTSSTAVAVAIII